MVEIRTGHYIGGSPTLKYTIEINGVSISLSDEDFTSLCTELGETLKEDREKALTASEKQNNNIKKVQELRKDIINIFWEGEEDSDYYIRRPLKEIDENNLVDVLGKYNRFLGFE